MSLHIFPLIVGYNAFPRWRWFQLCRKPVDCCVDFQFATVWDLILQGRHHNFPTATSRSNVVSNIIKWNNNSNNKQTYQSLSHQSRRQNIQNITSIHLPVVPRDIKPTFLFIVLNPMPRSSATKGNPQFARNPLDKIYAISRSISVTSASGGDFSVAKKLSRIFTGSTIQSASKGDNIIIENSAVSSRAEILARSRLISYTLEFGSKANKLTISVARVDTKAIRRYHPGQDNQYIGRIISKPLPFNLVCEGDDINRKSQKSACSIH